MPKKKFTDAAVKRFSIPKTGRLEYWDSLTPGFGLRVTSKGKKSWILMTRVYNEMTRSKTLARFTLGSYPTMDLANARKTAGAKLDTISNDIVARIDTRAVQRKVAPKHTRAIEDAVAEFFRLHINPNLRDSTAEQYRIAWHVHTLPRWSNRDIDDIKRSDIIGLMDEIVAEGKPIAANRTLAAIRKFFVWAAPRYELKVIPTIGVTPPTNEKAR
ncbi:MAG: integrase arm-type DNA-binding domain-containing protein, partial [Haliea sp.]